MTFSLVKVRRRPDWPVWAIGVVAVWLALVGATCIVSSITHHEFTTCLLKLTTGTPCPTCGTTRMCLSLLHGQVVQAFLFNPLMFVVFSVAGLGLLLRFAFRLGVKIDLTRAEGRIVWILAICALALNWVYVILYVG